MLPVKVTVHALKSNQFLPEVFHVRMPFDINAKTAAAMKVGDGKGTLVHEEVGGRGRAMVEGEGAVCGGVLKAVGEGVLRFLLYWSCMIILTLEGFGGLDEVDCDWGIYLKLKNFLLLPW